MVPTAFSGGGFASENSTNHPSNYLAPVSGIVDAPFGDGWNDEPTKL